MKRQICSQGVGSGGAPAKDGVAPAGNVVATGKVGAAGIPDVIDSRGGMPAGAAGDPWEAAGGGGVAAGAAADEDAARGAALDAADAEATDEPVAA